MDFESSYYSVILFDYVTGYCFAEQMVPQCFACASDDVEDCSTAKMAIRQDDIVSEDIFAGRQPIFRRRPEKSEIIKVLRMFWVKGFVSGRAFDAFDCLEVKLNGTLARPEPHFFQNSDPFEFLVSQLGRFLCFRFFFSSVNKTVRKLFSVLKLSSGIQEISPRRLPHSLNNERAARARKRKYSSLIVLVLSRAFFNSSSSMTVSRFSRKALPLTRVRITPPASYLLCIPVKLNQKKK